MVAFLNLIPRWALFAAIAALLALSGWLGWSMIGVQSDLLESQSNLSAAQTEKADLEMAVEKANTQAANEATGDAAIEPARTLGDVLGECSKRYQSLAEKADRINSDRLMLMQAWPKTPEFRHNTN